MQNVICIVRLREYLRSGNQEGIVQHVKGGKAEDTWVVMYMY